MAGDSAEHRGDSLPERVAALEAALEQVAFDSLPLRKLKDFLEDNLILDGKNSIMPGTVTEELLNNVVINLIAAGADGPGAGGKAWASLFKHPYYDRWCGHLSGGNTSGLNTTDTNMYVMRFTAPENILLSDMTLQPNTVQGGCGSATVQYRMALYDERMTTRLALRATDEAMTIVNSYDDAGLNTHKALHFDTAYQLVKGTNYAWCLLPRSHSGCVLGFQGWSGFASALSLNLKAYKDLAAAQTLKTHILYSQQMIRITLGGGGLIGTPPADLYTTVKNDANYTVVAAEGTTPWFLLNGDPAALE